MSSKQTNLLTGFLLFLVQVGLAWLYWGWFVVDSSKETTTLSITLGLMLLSVGYTYFGVKSKNQQESTGGAFFLIATGILTFLFLGLGILMQSPL